MDGMAHGPADLPNDPALVVTNPDEDVTAAAFRDWMDHRQVGEPANPAVRAADTLSELRASGLA